jgi:hypothetical protein
MLSTDMAAMRKCIFTFSLAKMRWKAEEIWKNFELYIYEHIHYVCYSACKNLPKKATP